MYVDKSNQNCQDCWCYTRLFASTTNCLKHSLKKKKKERKKKRKNNVFTPASKRIYIVIKCIVENVKYKIPLRNEFFTKKETQNGRVGRVFANGPRDLGSIPGCIIPKTLKMVLDTSLLNTQQYKVRIEGKVEQFRERSGAPLHLSVVAIETGAI